MDRTSIYPRYDLCISIEKIYIEPLNEDGGRIGEDCLVIDRVTGEVSSTSLDLVPLDVERRVIFGVIGIIRLIAGPYLLVITNSELVGRITDHQIWKVTGTDVIPYTRTTLHLTEKQVRENRLCLSMVQSVLGTDGFFYSYTFDLTHTMQRLQNTEPDFRLNAPMHERADQRFVWNRHVLTDLTLHQEAWRFALPVMQGFVGIRRCVFGQTEVQLALVSRRSWYRAGTRFFTRGLDEHGHSANFVETEQVLECNNYICAFVQTRGSLPLFWSQKPNLCWQPTPQVVSEDQERGFRAHLMDQQMHLPGTHILVNLVNRKGREKRVGEILQGVFDASAMHDIKYVHFDFHGECRNMKWDRLSLLRDQLRQHIKEFQYFMSRVGDAQDEIVQSGYFRTNCMDSLDRTNVVQSMLAKESLRLQLIRLGIIDEAYDLGHNKEFDFQFRNLWADNADLVSLQYAGTGALKTDFTRFGSRTYLGLLNDGRNALRRYVKNNFFDGTRQDAIDMFLGNFVFEKETSLDLDRWRSWRGAVLVFLVVAFCMLLLSFFLSTEHTLYFLLFWGLVLLVLLAVIYYNGEDFVDKPKLKQD